MPSLRIKGRLEDGQGRVYCLWCLGGIPKPRKVSEFCSPRCRARWNRRVRSLIYENNLDATPEHLAEAQRYQREGIRDGFEIGEALADAKAGDIIEVEIGKNTVAEFDRPGVYEGIHDSQDRPQTRFRRRGDVSSAPDKGIRDDKKQGAQRR